jgi:hypothetical protein
MAVGVYETRQAYMLEVDGEPFAFSLDGQVNLSWRWSAASCPASVIIRSG